MSGKFESLDSENQMKIHLATQKRQQEAIEAVRILRRTAFATLVPEEYRKMNFDKLEAGLRAPDTYYLWRQELAEEHNRNAKKGKTSTSALQLT